MNDYHSDSTATRAHRESVYLGMSVSVVQVQARNTTLTWFVTRTSQFT